MSTNPVFSRNGSGAQPPGMDTIEERLPPHSIEAEEAVLGSLLIDPDAVFEVQSFLQAADFYRAANRWTYEAILALHARQTPVDVVTLIEELRRVERLEEAGGESYVINLLNAVPTSINVEAYGRMVREAAVRRRLVAAAGLTAKLAWDEGMPIDQVVGEAERALFAVSGEMTADAVTDARTAFDALFDVTAERRAAGGMPVGVPSGLIDLDRILRGFKRGDLYIIAGRPSMGKSSFATSLIHHMAGKMGQRVLMFTLEMSVEQQSRRLASMEAGISYQDLEEGRMDDEGWQRFAAAAGRWSELTLWIDDTAGITPSQMAARARRVYAEHGLDILFVDYLQLMGVDDKAWSDNHRVSLISAGLKKLAKDLNIPVVALCQLNRAVENRSDKRPSLADLRDSGSLEQDASAVMFLYRDDYYNPDTSDKPNITEVIVAKHRNGPRGSADVFFNARTMRFANLGTRELKL